MTRPSVADRLGDTGPWIPLPLSLLAAADELQLHGSDLPVIAALMAYGYYTPTWPRFPCPIAWLMRCAALSRRAAQRAVRRLETKPLPLLETSHPPNSLYTVYDLTPLLRVLTILHAEAKAGTARWTPQSLDIEQLRIPYDHQVPPQPQEVAAARQAIAAATRRRTTLRARPHARYGDNP